MDLFFQRPAIQSQRALFLSAICLIYLSLAGVFSTLTLDVDEFLFVREPYELFGGDYTTGFLKRGEYLSALNTAAKSYYFYWTYRPLNSPIISERDKLIFAEEEKEFGYRPPKAVQFNDAAAVEKYQSRLIVPEPDRFYTHGAGKPLLPAILTVPQLALLKAFGVNGAQLLQSQFHKKNDGIFIIVRLIQIFAGLVSIITVFAILQREICSQRALFGALIFAIFPVTIKYFPNIHHDFILVPFFLLAIYFYIAGCNVKAGFFFGLALASKNLAIILLPAIAVDLAIMGITIYRRTNWSEAFQFFRTKMFGVVTLVIVAVATLTPFANPISYGQEILSPVQSRPIDPRGEDMERWKVITPQARILIISASMHKR